jgi:hypothetical protein
MAGIRGSGNAGLKTRERAGNPALMLIDAMF